MTPVASSCPPRATLLGLVLLVLSVGPGSAQSTASVTWGRAEPDLVGTVATRSLHFDHITIMEGLSQNSVHAIEQDRRGFLWFGTSDGLNRYDGRDFTIFRHVPFDSTSLTGNHVTVLYDDGQGYLWIGTRDGGLNRFDHSQHQFRRYANGPRRPITAITEDAHGNLWIGTNGEGVFRLRKDSITSATPSFDVFAADTTRDDGLTSPLVRDILVDRDDVIWVATAAGLDRLVTDSTNQVTRLRTGPTFEIPPPPGHESHGPTSLLEDRSGRLWVGSASGVSVFQPGAGTFTHVRHRYHDVRYGWGRVTDMAEATSGILWLTSHAALMRFDPETRTFSYYQHDPADPQSLSSHSSTTVVQDRSEVIWIGTNGFGINVHDPKSTRFRTFRPTRMLASRLAGFSVYTLFEDTANNVWINAHVLYRWDRESGALYTYETASTRPDAFGNTNVWALAEDSTGTLWAGTDRGLYAYVPETNRYRHYTHAPGTPDGLPETAVHALYLDEKGTLWTVTKNYLSKLVDPQRGQFTHIRYTDTPAPLRWTFPSPYKDARDVFWLGSREGLVRVDPNTKTVRRYRHDPNRPGSISSDNVLTIRPDPRRPSSRLWVGTGGGGLNLFDIDTEHFTHFTVADGLPNNVVYGLLNDGNGHLWLSSNLGLARFNPETGDVKTYDVHDGLQSNEFNSGAYFKSTTGDLFFGGVYGFTVFHPSDITDNPYVPPIVITGLALPSRAHVARGDPTSGQPVISETDTVTISHRDNVITFEFAALDYSAPEKNRYAYRMDGFDEEWVQSGPRTVATYTNLPPGQYAFRVKGTNNDGVWNEDGASLAVFVSPPWWRTWWAYSAYVATLIAGIFIVDRVQRRRLLHRERERARLREAEIHAEAAKRQSATLRNLDEMKSRFFANVSHEFRTPLTLTIGPLEDLRDRRDEVLPQDVRDQIDLALRNARRVLVLINELLDLSKLEAGGLTVDPQPGDFAGFLRRIAATYRPLATRRSIDFRCEIPDVPVPMAFDEGILERVFANLLSNAVKFTPSGGSVQLAFHPAENTDDGDEVIVRVRDTGPGIPADEIDRIFERFYQASRTKTDPHVGTGIGLSLAWELVHLHGGTITVESEEAFGSTFSVHVPFTPTTAPDVETSEDDNARARASDASIPGSPSETGSSTDGADRDSNPQQPSDSGSPTNPTVLVVDDNSEMRSYIRGHLISRYHVVEAENGRKALSTAHAIRPDVILSDVMMPEMDGYELCERFKHDPDLDSIPVILLTARASRTDRLEGLSGGADAYLVKPFDVDELQTQIENLLASRQRLRERFATTREVHVSDIEPVSSDQAFLERIRLAIEEHLGDESFSVEILAEDVGLSRVHLYRRLQTLIGQSPSALIRTMRLERAAQLLSVGAGSISEVAYAVGFKSVSHFSRAFREQFGTSPSAYATDTSSESSSPGRRTSGSTS